ncbi:MAG: ABC transporter substrate-binding protein [Alphaproteobacteria bacterium]
MFDLLRRAAVIGGAVALVGAAAARADEISVTQFGSILDGLPDAIAMDKGFFKKAGVNITGILTSKGGGTTVRNVLASGLPYGEVSLAAAVSAFNQGYDIRIVAVTVHTLGDMAWVVPNDSPIKNIKDLVGKKISISSPKSVTDMVSTMILDKAGIPLTAIQRPTLGQIGAGLTAMDAGAVQAAWIVEPIYSKVRHKYRIVVNASDYLPPMVRTVAITTPEFMKKEPAKLRALLAGRREGVDDIAKNPHDAEAILAKQWNLEPEIAAAVMANVRNMNYWSTGRIDIPAMNEMVRGLKIIGEIKDNPDWSKIVDRSFLPADLQN